VLANIIWTHPEHSEVVYSFRVAGGFLAELREDGSRYTIWSCCGLCAQIAPESAAPLVGRGWHWKLWPEK
jgi:hypothetical protein